MVTGAGASVVNAPADRFTYEGTPTVTGVSPNLGSLDGGDQVTITGTNLDGVTEVDFGAGNPSFDIATNTATQVTVFSPPVVSGTVDLQVITAAGTSPVNAPADRFTYTSTPTIASVSPSAGTPNGYTSVTIVGANLDDATAVSFGGTPADSFYFDSFAGDLVATSPPGTLGTTVDIRVTTGSGTTAITSADHYTYANVPAVDSITPSAGPVGGGTQVTISGSNLGGRDRGRFRHASDVPGHQQFRDRGNQSAGHARRLGGCDGDDAEWHFGRRGLVV